MRPKKFNDYAAPKFAIFAAVALIKKFNFYIATKIFPVRTDSQTISWLETHSLDESVIGCWINILDQNDNENVSLFHNKQTNADYWEILPIT